MDSHNLLYRRTVQDECYTPAYAVAPVLKYIRSDWIVWCPFDTADSEYVRQIGLTNRVVHSHIDNGQDFHEHEPDEWDCIISNPPFSRKRQTFERALGFGKPVCLLMALTWLNDKYSKWVFKEAGRQMQLLMFDKRVHFLVNGAVSKKTTFSSGYFCSDFLPRDIVIEALGGV